MIFYELKMMYFFFFFIKGKETIKINIFKRANSLKTVKRIQLR